MDLSVAHGSPHSSLRQPGNDQKAVEDEKRTKETADGDIGAENGEERDVADELQVDEIVRDARQDEP